MSWFIDKANKLYYCMHVVAWTVSGPVGQIDIDSEFTRVDRASHFVVYHNSTWQPRQTLFIDQGYTVEQLTPFIQIMFNICSVKHD